MVEQYSNDSQKLLPGMNILVQLDYHHIVKEYNSYSKFYTSKSTRKTMTLIGSSQNKVEYYTNDCQELWNTTHILSFKHQNQLVQQWLWLVAVKIGLTLTQMITMNCYQV